MVRSLIFLSLFFALVCQANEMTFSGDGWQYGENVYTEDGITVSTVSGGLLHMMDGESFRIADAGGPEPFSVQFSMSSNFNAGSVDLSGFSGSLKMTLTNSVGEQIWLEQENYESLVIRGFREGELVAEETVIIEEMSGTHYFGPAFEGLDRLTFEVVQPNFLEIFHDALMENPGYQVTYYNCEYMPTCSTAFLTKLVLDPILPDTRLFSNLEILSKSPAYYWEYPNPARPPYHVADLSGDGLDKLAMIQWRSIYTLDLSEDNSIQDRENWLPPSGVEWDLDEAYHDFQDMNGDGLVDFVSVTDSAFAVALSEGDAFPDLEVWASLQPSEGWGEQVCTIEDLYGDLIPEWVCVREDGVFVFESTGDRLLTPTRIGDHPDPAFESANGEHASYVFSDLDLDGTKDLVFFGQSGTYVSWLHGSGLSQPELLTEGYGYDQGWRSSDHLRYVEDINNDGYPDVIGFFNNGVFVSLFDGSALSEPVRWSRQFGNNAGWGTFDKPRKLLDINNDGLLDIVGVGLRGVYTAVNSGTQFAAQEISLQGVEFMRRAGGGDFDTYPTFFTDVNGDAKPDVVVISRDGTMVSYNQF